VKNAEKTSRRGKHQKEKKKPFSSNNPLGVLTKVKETNKYRGGI
jgi:hypothetical protein